MDLFDVLRARNRFVMNKLLLGSETWYRDVKSDSKSFLGIFSTIHNF